MNIIERRLNAKSLFWVCLLFPLCLLAKPRWISFDGTQNPTPPRVEIVTGGRTGVTYRITIPGMLVDDKTINGATYHTIELPGVKSGWEVGNPELPNISRLIAIAPRTDVSIKITAQTRELTGYYVFPYQKPRCENEPPPPFTINEAVYQTNAFYPVISYGKNGPSIFRDYRVMLASFRPITFNPTTKVLKISTVMTIECKFAGENQHNTIPTWPTISKLQFDAIYRSTIANYGTLGGGPPPVPPYLFPVYLIITDASFANDILRLADWKRQKGMIVHVRIVPTQVARDTTAIKNCIQYCYENYNLDYVLLVGDAVRKPFFPIRPWEPCLPVADWTPFGGFCEDWSDAWYACIAGDDTLPDVAIGRLAVWNSAQLNATIDKIFAYERYPWTGWNIRNHDLVAAKEPNGYWACKRDSIRDKFLNVPHRPGWSWHEDNGNDPQVSNNTVKSNINDFLSYPRGVSLVNYRGHGSYWSGWSDWNLHSENFTNADVYDLYNYNSMYEAWLPMVFSICCETGDVGYIQRDVSQIPFDTTCLAEAWLRNPHGGGVGAIAAPQATNTDWNHKFDTELYRCSFDNNIYNVGWTLNAAKMRTFEAYGSDPDYNRGLKRFHYLGDPENDVYTDWLGYLSATHPIQITTDPTIFNVHVSDGQGAGVGMAVVCLYKENDIHQAGYTNAYGDISFQIGPLTTGTLYVTADKHNYGPYQGTCIVVQGGGGGQSADLSSIIPKAFSFTCSSSNPATGIIRISLGLPNSSRVSLNIYDAIGKKVANLLDSRFLPGYHNITWRGADSQNAKLTAGIYFMVLTAENFKCTKKIVFMR